MLKRNDRGFTLIEVIVVVVIVSIIITIASLATGDTLRNNKLRYFAWQLYEELRFAQQQAIIRSMILGFSISDNNYQFYCFANNNPSAKAQWILYNKNKLLRPQRIPNFINVNFIASLESQPINDDTPMAVITTDGQITAVRLDIGIKDKTARFQIVTNPAGNIQLIDRKSL